VPGPGRAMSDLEHFILRAGEARFSREGEDRVSLTYRGRSWAVGSVAMAFPLSGRNRMVVVRDEQGAEIGILDDISGLDAASRRIVKEELERSYFLPRIVDVQEVTEELGVITWRVVTDRGPRTFQVRNVRQNMRRIGRGRVIIRDVDGNRYEVPDWTALPPRAQRWMELYL